MARWASLIPATDPSLVRGSGADSAFTEPTDGDMTGEPTGVQRPITRPRTVTVAGSRSRAYVVRNSPEGIRCSVNVRVPAQQPVEPTAWRGRSVHEQRSPEVRIKDPLRLRVQPALGGLAFHFVVEGVVTSLGGLVVVRSLRVNHLLPPSAVQLSTPRYTTG